MADQQSPERMAWRSTDVPRPAERAIHRTLEGETVVLDIDEGHYYVLNETATAVWRLCDGKNSLGDIVDTLCNEYDVTREAAQASVQSLMDDLVQARLVDLGTNAQQAEGT